MTKKKISDVAEESEFDWEAALAKLKKEINTPGWREKMYMEVKEIIQLKTIDIPKI